MRKPMIILLHTGYWLLYFLLVTIFLLSMIKVRPHGWEFTRVLLLSPFTIFSFLPAILGFYSYYTMLFDRWLIRKKLLTCLAFGLLFALTAGVITSVILGLSSFNASGKLHFRQTVSMSVFLLLLAGIHGIIGLVLKGFIRWYGDIRLKEELQRRQYATELALIKSQINPHFLFNTINNIDVLIGKDPEKASLFLNKLSGIIRFMLYETRTELVPLSKELDYLDAYLDLQRIRSANLDFVRYTLQGQPDNLMIAPMLLIAYIENAFKHAANKREGPVVQIDINITADQIFFRCENSYLRNGIQDGTYGGLGNELLQRRLELLYPRRHQLLVADNAGIYSVQLTLETNED